MLRMFYIKVIFGNLFQINVFAVLLLVPARTWNWTDAIVLMSVYSIISFILVIFLAIYTPRALEARMTGALYIQAAREEIVAPILFVAIILCIVLNPLDVFYFHLLPPPSIAIKYVGMFLFIAGYAFIGMTIAQNEFATPTILDVSERDQQLVDTGFYAWIRHPMYTGIMIWMVGTGLWLESYAASFSTLFLCPLLFFRIRTEENILNGKLPGYEKYILKVKYRLFPYIW